MPSDRGRGHSSSTSLLVVMMSLMQSDDGSTVAYREMSQKRAPRRPAEAHVHER